MIKSDKEVHAILDEYIPNEIQVVFEIPYFQNCRSKS